MRTTKTLTNPSTNPNGVVDACATPLHDPPTIGDTCRHKLKWPIEYVRGSALRLGFFDKSHIISLPARWRPFDLEWIYARALLSERIHPIVGTGTIDPAHEPDDSLSRIGVAVSEWWSSRFFVGHGGSLYPPFAEWILSELGALTRGESRPFPRGGLILALSSLCSPDLPIASGLRRLYRREAGAFESLAPRSAAVSGLLGFVAQCDQLTRLLSPPVRLRLSGPEGPITIERKNNAVS